MLYKTSRCGIIANLSTCALLGFHLGPGLAPAPLVLGHLGIVRLVHCRLIVAASSTYRCSGVQATLTLLGDHAAGKQFETIIPVRHRLPT
jgi:hypothetical protein